MKQYLSEKRLDGASKSELEPHASRTRSTLGGAAAMESDWSDPVAAAHRGEPDAIMQLGGARNVPLRSQPLPANLVVRAQRQLGVDLSQVRLVEDEELAQQGKRGMAVDGRELHVAPQHRSDQALLWHEIVHLVQQRKAQGSASKEAEGAGGTSVSEGEELPAPLAGVEAKSPPAARVSSETAEEDATVPEPEAEAVAGAKKLLAGEVFEVRAHGTGTLYEEPKPELSTQGAEPDQLEGDEEPVSEVDPGMLEAAQKHVLQTTAMTWVSKIIGAPSSAVDEDFVKATLAWQLANGVEASGVLEHETLLAMAPELLNEAGVSKEAKCWYTGNGATLFKKTNTMATELRDSRLQAEDPGSQPIVAILAELELSEKEAFGNLSSVSDYKPGMKLEVTDTFLERALLWQLEARLGLALDAQLGTSALVHMGLDPGEKFLGNENYSVWNADNLEKGEVDPAVQELVDDGSFLGGAVDVITLGGTDKRTGDLTGDDGITFGMAHFTNSSRLKEFLELVSQQPGSDEAELDVEPLGERILQAHFGTADLEELTTTLLLDQEWPSLNNLYLAALVQAQQLEPLLSFLRDPEVKRLQFERFRSSCESRISTHRETFGGQDLTVGSAALIACLGNSSNNRLEKVEASAELEVKQTQAGLLYLDSDSGSTEYKTVAKLVWQSQFDNLNKGEEVRSFDARQAWHAEIDALVAATKITEELGKVLKPTSSGPTHRLRRLLCVLKTFGSTWGKPYTATTGALR
ncbi:MAG: DUF4157 domain-containing protein [Myxococcota bacterium]|jgi:hypothetical protein|nr:DUF4157 domain-containing protein [Myxococcota bacterium]